MVPQTTVKLILLGLATALALAPTAGCTRALGTYERGVCGNGEAEPDYGEQCDDGNHLSGDGCTPDCQLEIPPGCGNGVLEPIEDCDDGNRAAGDGCDPDCRIEYTMGCGDGWVDPGEECDDGNHLPGDGCTPDCRIN